MVKGELTGSGFNRKATLPYGQVRGDYWMAAETAACLDLCEAIAIPVRMGFGAANLYAAPYPSTL